MTTAAPVQVAERITALDLVRGFALLGILIANINSSLPNPLKGIAFRSAESGTWGNAALELFTSVFVDGRFYTMFSLLFGAGFVIFIDRARARGVHAERLFMRRLAVLLLIGLAHGLLIWYGDILALYACFGFFLLAFVNMPWQRLWKWGLVFYCVPFAVYVIRTLLADGASMDPAALETARAARRAAAEAAVAIYTTGSWWDVAQQRFADILSMWKYLLPVVYGISAFGMFLIGAAVVRGGMLTSLDAHRAHLRRIAWIGFVIGTSLAVYSVLPFATGNGFVRMAIYTASAILQCLAYAAALALLLMHARAQRWLRPLASAGRMALTNYLMQSLVFTWIFCGYGLGIGDSLGRAATTALALVFFAMQIVFSHWWLARFRFGPMEWVWRTMTYGRAHPIRLPQFAG